MREDKYHAFLLFVKEGSEGTRKCHLARFYWSLPLWLLRVEWPQGRIAAERGASPRSVRQEGLLHGGCHRGAPP